MPTRTLNHPPSRFAAVTHLSLSNGSERVRTPSNAKRLWRAVRPSSRPLPPIGTYSHLMEPNGTKEFFRVGCCPRSTRSGTGADAYSRVRTDFFGVFRVFGGYSPNLALTPPRRLVSMAG